MELGHECLFIGGAVAEQLAAVVWDAQAVDSTRDLDGNDGIIDSVFCPRIWVVIGEAPKRSMQCSVFLISQILRKLHASLYSEIQ